ncbi:arylamine N-acetyltransferase [Streptomyces rectiverticillatus]|uniref:arylamine N-acetyltransferase family protein n=1 Tax=Streptomyces rectiverticillatus TaxID=173860 RepID=UPI0015C3F8F3|nr:arylamine N-acetyltransferase [Streptomyces rectiverticillatus]QLE74389.1 arylamine N-acetyltransferase [Streptomyces rectiverticillatus]
MPNTAVVHGPAGPAHPAAGPVRATGAPAGQPAAGATAWDTAALDLDAYLARTGLTDSTDPTGRTGPAAPTAPPTAPTIHPLPPTTPTLRALQRAHTAAVSFENVDVLLGRDMPLDTDALQRKLVRAGRGGYCFEQNLLFAAVLERLGFPVVRHLARVRRGSSRVRRRSHATLVVEADGRPWLCDVGFGDEGPLEPVPLAPGATVTTGDWTWRLDLEPAEDRAAAAAPGQWVLRSLHPDGWFDVYSLRLEHHVPDDFEAAHYWTSHHPRSPFTGRLVAQRGDDHVRHTLTDRTLAARYADGRLLRTELAPDEVGPVLRGTFGIALTAEESVLLQRHAASWTAS